MEFALKDTIVKAMEKCPACKAAIPYKRLPNQGELIHLDLFACYDHGAEFKCQALDVLTPLISGYDDRDNPKWPEGFDELVIETSDSFEKTRISKVKEYIKALSEEQRKDKALLRQDHKKVPDAPSIQCRIVSRAVEITAVLNFYNALRGKKYQHTIHLGWRWYYDKITEDLKKRFA